MKISHILSILEVLKDLCAIRQKSKYKKHFSKYCLQFFSTEIVLAEHKENCLKRNGKQTVKLKHGLIKFKNYLEQLVVPIKYLC